MEQKVHVKRRVKRKRTCYMCANKIDLFDYKAIESYKRFITDRGKIVPRRNSGICAKHQRVIAETIKRARYIGLLPYCID